jgi:hypothetical protein
LKPAWRRLAFAAAFTRMTSATNAPQAPAACASTAPSGGNTSTKPRPLISDEKLETQNGVRYSRNVGQKPMPAPGWRTPSHNALPMTGLMPAALSQIAGDRSK